MLACKGIWEPNNGRLKWLGQKNQKPTVNTEINGAKAT